jgi:hypothetical protein
MKEKKERGRLHARREELKIFNQIRIEIQISST